LQVVWEIEPGAKIVERVALPDPTDFDSPDKLDAFLDAVRWGAASTADHKNIQSPFRSGIEIEDYQLDPVERAIAHSRLVMIGGDSYRLHEEIIAAGGFVKDQKWGSRLNVGQTESAVAGATAKDPSA
jgi:hypothetical protein